MEKGHWVVLVTAVGTAPFRTVRGEVQSTDATGVRVTTFDGVTRRPSGHDVWLPWASITSALVFTEDHSRGLFDEDASRWESTIKANPKLAFYEV